MLRSSVILLFAAFLADVSPSYAAGPDLLNTTQSAYDNWVSTQEAIAGDRREWAEEREFLKEEIKLLQEEITVLQEKATRLDEEIAKSIDDTESLESENEQLKAASQTVEDFLPKLEEDLRTLHPAFPAPLTENLEMLYNRLPQGEGSTAPSVSERLQAVVGILSQSDRFNGTMSVSSELREQEAGDKVSVSILYSGLGAAWFVDEEGTFAGVGYPTPEGWQWQVRNESAGEIQKAVAVQSGSAPAAFVLLPVEIK